MKVLIVSQYYHPYVSGLTVYAKRLAQGLASRGNNVIVLTMDHSRGCDGVESMDGVVVHRLPCLLRFHRGSFTPLLLWKFIRLLRSADVINIHLPLFEAGVMAFLASAIGHRRVVITYHCDISINQGLIGFILGALYSISLQLAAKMSLVIIMNSFNYAQYSKLSGFIGKVKAIVPPILDDRFIKKDGKVFRLKHGLSMQGRVIGFVGRLVHEKGLIYLIKALPSIIERHPFAQCVIAGEGKLVAGGEKESVLTQLRVLINQLGLTSKVVFTGLLSDEEVVSFYSACDLLVLPSVDPLESFGMVQAEAMLCGCPVVASDMPGVNEAIGLTGMGICVQPRDSGRLAKAVCDVLDNPELYIKDNKIIREFFSLSKTIDQYESAFRSAVD